LGGRALFRGEFSSKNPKQSTILSPFRYSPLQTWSQKNFSPIPTVFLDTATFSRDLIDLAFLEVRDIRKTAGFAKASQAYGPALGRDLDKAIDNFLSDLAWVDRCAKALDFTAPRALISTLGKLADRLVGLVADLFVTLEGH